MDLDKLHQSLRKSFEARNNQYHETIGNTVLVCCLISSCILMKYELKEEIKSWLQLRNSNNTFLRFSNIISNIENNYCPMLFSFGFEIEKQLTRLSDNELRTIISYSIDNFTNHTSQIVSLIDSLNQGNLSREIDDLLKLIITEQRQFDIFTFGVRVINYVSDIRFRKFKSYNLDKYRWREALACKILLQRKDEVTMNYLPHDLDSEPNYDIGIISGNNPVSIEEWQELVNKYSYQQNQEYYQSLIKWCQTKKFDNIPDNSLLAQQIPNTDITVADILNTLIRIKPTGKLYLIIRAKTWQSDYIQPLRRFIVINHLLRQVIFIKTNRLNPWVLVVITHQDKSNHKAYLLNERFYVDQGLKYNLNDKVKERLALLINNQKSVTKIAGNIDYSLFEYLNYNLDPNSCLNFELRIDTSKSQDTKNLYTLESVCSIIFRGPDLSNKDLSNIEVTPGYFMIGHSAISEEGLKPENLTPISEDIYQQYQANYGVYPGDIITLSRSTTNRLILIPISSPYCIANVNIIVLRPNPKIVDHTFLYLWLSSSRGKALLSLLEKGTSLKSISIKALKQLPLELPSLNIQQKFANKYKLLLSRYHKAQKTYNDNLSKLHHAIDGLK